MLKKISIILMTIFIISIPSCVLANKEEDKSISIDSLIKSQIEKLDIGELEEVIDEINKNTNEFLPKINLKEYLTSMIKGKEVLGWDEIAKGMIKTLFKEVIANWSILSKVLFLSIICSILTSLQGAFENETISELAFYVCYLILISLSIKSFIIAIDIAKDAISNMVILMQALLPVLITLLLAVGAFTTSTLFQPIVLGSVSVVGTLMKDIILPLILFSTIIGIVSKISSKIQITKLSGLIRQISLYIIGISITLFMGIMSIRGAIAPKMDGLTIKTAKFAVDKFVPIVGKFLSDTMETVVGCSTIIKNGVGIIGMIGLFLISIIPIIKMISLIFVYKFTTVVIEPIANPRIVESLTEISKALTLVLAVIAIVTVMFFITVTIIIGAGNTTAMFR
ncbi:stage III sporulation protein AE [Gottschalkia purinilytica]|uniref:Stage III sporulation protein AE n=1 Tax=Gottschalkia purinilytica TaxID=1503 RepID=A0A0L0W7X1_GOTPU|nr:stage III sporulation protein AE [Gottschalkia purinilytica]KNF07395.1 stage III sporulation protein AE [Gottschalkia purinilytica]